jgi:hypothetical protein
MKRHALLAAAIVAAGLVGLQSARGNELISEMEANRHGLSRPWFAQVGMDSGRSRVIYSVLDDGVLFIQTNRAMVHAINAETGRTLWSRLIGRPDHPSLVPGVNADLLAVVNGSRLYVVNRFTGEMLFDMQVNGAPGAGPALSSKRAFVPMTTGLVMAYRLQSMTDPGKELGKVDATPEEQAAAEEGRRDGIRLRQDYIPPLACQADGRAMVQPLTTFEDDDNEYCVWPTDRGYLNVGLVDTQVGERFGIKYRMEVSAGIEARPAYVPPSADVPGDNGLIIAGGRDGFVYALLERSGEVFWRFSAGQPVVESPAVVGDRVFVSTQLGGMFCLEVKTGKELWFVRGANRFLAAGKERVYVGDRSNRLLALNARTGQRLDTVHSADLSLAVSNDQTDRIYLIDSRGMVQCLREIELTEPLMHKAQRAERPATQQSGMPGAQPKPAAAPAEGAAPAEAAPPANAEEDPFG